MKSVMRILAKAFNLLKYLVYPVANAALPSHLRDSDISGAEIVMLLGGATTDVAEVVLLLLVPRLEVVLPRHCGGIH